MTRGNALDECNKRSRKERGNAWLTNHNPDTGQGRSRAVRHSFVARRTSRTCSKHRNILYHRRVHVLEEQQTSCSWFG